MEEPQPITKQPIGDMTQQPIGMPQQPIDMTQQPIGMVQQPAMMGTTNVVVVTQQPQQPQYRDWSTGLCGCFEDCGSCFLGLCCPLFLLTDISQRMGEGCCFAYCCPNALLGLRVKIRTENFIKGSLCDDYCVVCWCSPLVACQISRELRNMGR